MNLSRLKYSAWISLVIVLAASCRSPELCITGEPAAEFRKSLCEGSFKKMSFKANVSFKENELRGIMLIKKAPDGQCRIAFYNELGMTYLEGALENSHNQNRLAVQNIAPVLDHKIFVKNFAKCMNAILCQQPPHVPSSPLPHFSSSPPPCSPASTPSPGRDNMIMVYLRNGFSMELSPQK